MFYIGLVLGGVFVACVLLLIYILIQNQKRLNKIRKQNEKLKYDRLFKVDILKRLDELADSDRKK